MDRTIYSQFDASFRHVSAFAILRDGKHVANITFKHGSACTGYVHWIGLQMTRGRATGYGYDKQSRACAIAACVKPVGDDPVCASEPYRAFIAALARGDHGEGWDRSLRKAGFEVLTVIA